MTIYHRNQLKRVTLTKEKPSVKGSNTEWNSSNILKSLMFEIYRVERKKD